MHQRFDARYPSRDEVEGRFAQLLAKIPAPAIPEPSFALHEGYPIWRLEFGAWEQVGVTKLGDRLTRATDVAAPGIPSATPASYAPEYLEGGFWDGDGQFLARAIVLAAAVLLHE